VTAVIHGVVRGPDGSPVAQARAYFASGPGPFPDIAALTDPEGRFTLSAPAPGGYVIECAAEGFAPEGVSLDVKEGEESRIEITLRPAP
jgi:hypothetical protein